MKNGYLNVLESIIHESTIASLVSIGPAAVNQVLFRQADKLTSLPEVHSLESTSGRKAPARSALTLVLNRSDGSVAAPVNISWQALNMGWDHKGGADNTGCRVVLGTADVSVQSGYELMVKHVSVFVHLQAIGLLSTSGLTVVTFDLGLPKKY
jgi:hypothetical protein